MLIRETLGVDQFISGRETWFFSQFELKTLFCKAEETFLTVTKNNLNISLELDFSPFLGKELYSAVD